MDFAFPITTTLFAALDVATGQVMADHYKRRRRVEFLDFMNQVVDAFPCRLYSWVCPFRARPLGSFK
jgi:hypothetical protein